MDAATRSIYFETYICDFTDSGARIGEALERAAQRGVRVQLLADGFGTGELAPVWLERLSRSGVQYQVFAPLGFLGLLLPQRWRRLHRKLCVVDDALLLDSALEPVVKEAIAANPANPAEALLSLSIADRLPNRPARRCRWSGGACRRPVPRARTTSTQRARR